MSLPKILAVMGPTASGKSDLAVELALAFNGEVISADSRQVYRGLDVTTGKITTEEMRGVPHHLLDVADPNEQYDVARFKREAEAKIDEILSRGKLPILCGGTGLYIKAVADNFIPPSPKPNLELRKELARKTVDEMFEELQKIDPERAETIDPKNPRRLVRALEIAHELGTVPKIPDMPKKYDALQIAIRTDRDVLRERIERRVKKRLELGMVEETKRLHEAGLSFERMRELGLEYRFLAEYLKGEITAEKMAQEIAFKDWQYAKRQITWIKREKDVKWFSLEEKDEIFEEVRKFLKKEQSKTFSLQYR